MNLDVTGDVQAHLISSFSALASATELVGALPRIARACFLVRERISELVRLDIDWWGRVNPSSIY